MEHEFLAEGALRSLWGATMRNARWWAEAREAQALWGLHGYVRVYGSTEQCAGFLALLRTLGI